MFDLFKFAAFIRAQKIQAENPEVFNQIKEQLSEFPKNKHFLYTSIIFDHYDSNKIPLNEAIFDGLQTIRSFEKIKQYLEEKDISAYDNYNQLQNTVSKTLLKLTAKKSNKYKQTSNDEQYKALENNDAVKVFEDDQNVVYRINNITGSRAFGKDTTWCVTKQSGFFEMYTSQNLIFYFCINKQLPEDNPVQKTAIRVIRTLDNEINEVAVTRKTNDGDNYPIDIVPGYEKFLELIKRDALQQPVGLVVKVKNGTATVEEAKEYWRLLDPASFHEKFSIINQLELKRYSLPEINEFFQLKNKTEEELITLHFQQPKNCSIAELLAKKTNNQKLLSELFKTPYPSVKIEVAKKINDPKIISEIANSEFNNVKYELLNNPIANKNKVIMEYLLDTYEPEEGYDLNLKNLAIRCAEHLKPTEIEKFQQVVMNDPEYAYRFARDIPGANIQELQKVVMKDPQCAFLFARGVKGANIQELQKAVMNNHRWAYYFAKDIPGANIQELQKAVMNNPDYAIAFAKDIPGANIQELQKAVMNNRFFAYEFAREVPGANIRKLPPDSNLDKSASFSNIYYKQVFNLL